MARACPPPPISGVVRHLEAPILGRARHLLQPRRHVADALRTADDGTFVVASAPVGVYDLIAYKRGFSPALQRLWHQAASEQISAVSIKLAAQAAAPAAAPPATLWDLRGRLPADVLREIALEELDEDGNAPMRPPSPLDRLRSVASDRRRAAHRNRRRRRSDHGLSRAAGRRPRRTAQRLEVRPARRLRDGLRRGRAGRRDDRQRRRSRARRLPLGDRAALRFHAPEHACPSATTPRASRLTA